MSKNLKKLLCAILATATILSFTACSSRDEEDPSSDTSDESSTSQPIGDDVDEPDASEDSESVEPEEPEAETLNKLEAAIAQNDDVKGWITIPNTEIDNEILQNTNPNLSLVDRNLYYERRDITEAYNWYGCYFLDAGNVLTDRNSLTANTIIYGHNMDDDPNGKKFAQLTNYLDIEFAKNNPYIYVSTETDEMVFQVFSVFYTDTSFQYHLEKPDATTLQGIIDGGIERSEHIYDVDVDSGDKILTLSTCTYVFPGGENNKEQRLVIQAKLLAPGEDTATTVTVTDNPSPKQPTFSKQY